MRRTPATQRRPVEIPGRPEGGAGGTGPLVVPPAGPALARSQVIASLHQLIEILSDLTPEGPRELSVGAGQDVPLLLNAMETGRLLSISRTKVLDLAARGQIPSVRVGGSVRIPRDRLIAWIDDGARYTVGGSVQRVPEWAHVIRSQEV